MYVWMRPIYDQNVNDTFCFETTASKLLHIFLLSLMFFIHLLLKSVYDFGWFGGGFWMRISISFSKNCQHFLFSFLLKHFGRFSCFLSSSKWVYWFYQSLVTSWPLPLRDFQHIFRRRIYIKNVIFLTLVVLFFFLS